MQYLRYSPVDRQFLVLEADLPPGAVFNAVDPVDGINFAFSLESRFPLQSTEAEIRYGTIEEEVESDPSIGLLVISKETFDAAQTAELAARKAKQPPLAPLSRRQFFQGLTTTPYEFITKAEALAAVKNGEIPELLQSIIDTFPEDQRFSAEMLVIGASEFLRDHPFVEIFGGHQDLDEEQIDEFWRFAQTL